MALKQDCTIEQIARSLKNAKHQERGAILLIGAGCSVTAGIPDTKGIVKRIKEEDETLRYAYDATESDDYGDLMEALDPADQAKLISDYVVNAKLNWAHIAIAHLMAAGYISRILTTNFDNLIMRACSLAGVYPGVYDLAVSQHFNPGRIPGKAIIHLHGQHIGFVIVNAKSELTELHKRLKPVFTEHYNLGLPWLVVGYSGENDPLMGHFAEVTSFERRLYWAGYENPNPPDHLKKGLFSGSVAYAHYMNTEGADHFLMQLAQQLDCFSETLFSKPFDYMERVVNEVAPYPTFKDRPGIDLREDTLRRIRWAKENGDADDNSVLARDFIAGKTSAITSAPMLDLADLSVDQKAMLTQAFVQEGDKAQFDGKRKKVSQQDRLRIAIDHYEKALLLDPKNEEILLRLGSSYVDLASLATGSEADRLYGKAVSQYRIILDSNDNSFRALFDWGFTLQSHAKQKSGDEADKLLKLASDKYAEALKIKPDDHEALNNWGLALQSQAEQKSGDEADKLLKLASDKYAEALKIKTD